MQYHWIHQNCSLDGSWEFDHQVYMTRFMTALPKLHFYSPSGSCITKVRALSGIKSSIFTVSVRLL